MIEGNKKGFIVEANTLLSRYVGNINHKEVLSAISKDLELVLNKYLGENPMYEEDFPVEFENWLGKWRIESDGSTKFQPTTYKERVILNIKISESGEIETINKKDNE